MSPRSFICVIFSPVPSPSPPSPPSLWPSLPRVAPDIPEQLINSGVWLSRPLCCMDWSGARAGDGPTSGSAAENEALSQQARWKVLFGKWWMWREWLMRRLWGSRASYKIQGFIVTPKFTQESYLQFHETISFIKFFTDVVRLPASMSRLFLCL